MLFRMIISGLIVGVFTTFGSIAQADCIRSCTANLYVKLNYQPKESPHVEKKTDVLKTAASEKRDGRSGKTCVPSNILKAKKRACEDAVRDLGRRYSSPQRQREAVCSAVHSDRISFDRVQAGFPDADWYSIDQIYAYGKRDLVKIKGDINPYPQRFACDEGTPVALNPMQPRPSQPPVTSDSAAPPPPPTLVTGDQEGQDLGDSQTIRANSQDACEKWCDEHPECVRCDTKVGCGPGYKRIKSWRGPGKNWHACREADQGGSGFRSSEAVVRIDNNAPDLYISEFTLSPATPVKGQPVQVRIGVYNKGPARAGAFTVKWWPGENYKEAACSWALERMNARGGRILTCTYPGYPSWYGRIKTLAVADANDDVVEAKEENNDRKMTISVSR